LTATLLGEIQVILSEKRTSLSALQTGIAVFALPLSVLSILIATSKYYELSEVASYLVSLLLLCGALVILGLYLVVRAMVQIHRYDHLLARIKRKHGSLAEFVG
jgi:uncharacterized membrane protein YkgB